MNDLTTLLGEAEKYLKQQDVDRAAELFKLAHELDNGRSPLPAIGLARVAMMMGRVEDAQHLLDQVLAQHPRRPDALTFRGVAEELKGNLSAASSMFEKAIAADSQFALAHFNLGRVAAQQQRWEEAARHLRTATELEPEQSEALVLYGTAAYRAGQPQAAIHALTAAVQLDRNNVSAVATLADVLVEAGQLQLADQFLHNALERRPGAGLLHSKRAAIALRQGNTAQARAHLKAQTEVEPQNEEAWLSAAVLDVSLTQLDSAEACVRKALALNPNNWRAHYQLGGIYELWKLVQPAKAAYRNAIKLGGDWKPLNNLAALLVESGTPEELGEAESLAARACQLAPTEERFRALYNRALVLWKLGDKSASEKSAREAVKLGPAGDAITETARRFLERIA